jgi:TonB-dependent Receptor Plug Domain
LAFLVLCVSGPRRTLADESATVVAGHVVDARTRGPVAGARVAADGHEVATSADGSFSLSLASRPTTISVTLVGYLPQTVAADNADITVSLVPAVRFQDQAEVAGLAQPSPDAPSTLALRPTQVLQAAGALDNIFRVLHTLPGVSATEEFGSRLSVRGGGPDENLTVMDGVEISNPYRLLGLVSAFNPETVESFSLDTGGFSVSHGDRLSSLLIVHNRGGTESQGLAGSAALSLTDGNAIVEGKLPGAAKGSWIVTGRRTYYDLVANKIVDAELPTFTDLQSKLVWAPRAGTRLLFSGLRSRESADVSFDDDDTGDQGDFLDAARNDLAAVTLESTFGPRTTSRTIASWYRNTESFDVSARFQNQTQRSNAPDDSGFGQADIKFTRDLTVRDLALRQEFGFQLSDRNLLQAGAETHRLSTRVAWQIKGDRNPNAANGSSLRGGTGLPTALDSSVGAGRSGAWVQDRFGLGSRLVMDVGLRADRSEVNARSEFSPRLGAALSLDTRTRLRASFGKYTQSPGYDKLVQADYFLDLSQAGTLALPNERSLHTSFAIERDVTAGFLARAEMYYKSFSDLTVGRLETESERQLRIAQYDFPAELATSIPAAAQITSDPVGSGRGRAYGLDLYLAKRATSSNTRLTGWASYTLAVADREAYGRNYSFDYDRRHALSLVDNFQVKSWLEIATTLRIVSGFPMTPVLGLRVAATEDVLDQDRDGNRTELVPERDSAGRLTYVIDRGGLANLNSARLPTFARLDLRASFAPKGRSGRWLLYLDIINALSRKNAGTIDTTLEYDPSSDRPKIVNEYGGSIPLLPSFGVRFRF